MPLDYRADTRRRREAGIFADLHVLILRRLITITGLFE